MPVLTLNYLPDDTLAPPGLYQFGLAPEDEAMSAAQRALAGRAYARRRAGAQQRLGSSPADDVLSREFEGLGGTLARLPQLYAGQAGLLGRNRNAHGTVGQRTTLPPTACQYRSCTLQFDPRRRQDTDFIFLATDAPAGRLLKAQLKFHYSGDIPVYSTSSVNSLGWSFECRPQWHHVRRHAVGRRPAALDRASAGPVPRVLARGAAHHTLARHGL